MMYGFSVNSRLGTENLNQGQFATVLAVEGKCCVSSYFHHCLILLASVAPGKRGLKSDLCIYKTLVLEFEAQ